MVGAGHTYTHPYTVLRRPASPGALAAVEHVRQGRTERSVLRAHERGRTHIARLYGRQSYSARLNSAIATTSITSPSSAITAASTRLGTCQPNQVTPGASAWRAASGMSRWAKIARRIGSTA